METMDRILPNLDLVIVAGENTPPVIINGTDGARRNIMPVPGGN